MSFTIEELDNLSALARIKIRADEKEKMLLDMQAILGYVSEINEVEGALSRVKEDIYNIVRDDVVTNETGTKTEEILDNAPKVKDGYVQVEQVLK